jgi:ketosteroid isomerase-like protein
VTNTTVQPLGLPPVIERLVMTTNDHDLDGLVACFAPDYRLSMPTHPAGDFVGTEQVRRNWTGLFAGIPDLQVAVLAAAVRDADCWVEMEMRGTRRDGTPHLMRGPLIFTTGDDLIRACRFYVDLVDHGPLPFAPPGVENATTAAGAPAGPPGSGGDPS